MDEAENLIRRELYIIKDEFKDFAKAKVAELPKIEKFITPKIDLKENYANINTFYQKEMMNLAIYFSNSLGIFMDEVMVGFKGVFELIKDEKDCDLSFLKNKFMDLKKTILDRTNT